MKKQEFIDEIKARLEGIPEQEIQKSIDYYSEMIDDRIEDGMSEEEAVAEVGTVDDAVKAILEDIPLTQVIKAKTKPQRKLKTWEIVLLAVGSPIWVPLLITAIVLIVVLYLLIWVCVIVFWAVDLALFLAGIGAFAIGIAGLFRIDAARALLAIGGGMVLTGGSLMLVIPLVKLTKVTAKLAKKIVLWIKSLFVRKKKEPQEIPAEIC